MDANWRVRGASLPRSGQHTWRTSEVGQGLDTRALTVRSLQHRLRWAQSSRVRVRVRVRVVCTQHRMPEWTQSLHTSRMHNRHNRARARAHKPIVLRTVSTTGTSRKAKTAEHGRRGRGGECGSASRSAQDRWAWEVEGWRRVRQRQQECSRPLSRGRGEEGALRPILHCTAVCL